MKLEELCTAIIDCPHSTPKWQESGIPVVRNFNLNNSYISFSDGNVSYVDEDTYQQRIQRAIPEPGDVVISREAPMGVVGIIPEGMKCCMGQRLVLLKVDRSQCAPTYLLYALTSEYVQTQIRRIDTRGSIVSNIDLDTLRELEIPIVENSEEAANLLDVISRKIEMNTKIIAELESVARSVYDYWFTQFDFPDEHGNPYRSSGGAMTYSKALHRDIPAGWSVGSLAMMANIIMGQSPSGDSYNETGDGMPFFQGKADFGIHYPTRRVYTTQPQRIAEEDSILMSVRAPVGAMNFAAEQCCIGRGLASIQSISRSNRLFVYFSLEHCSSLFNALSNNGTTFGAIDGRTLHDLQIIIPPKEIQEQFSRMSEFWYSGIKTASKESARLAALRDRLLPLLMNGQAVIE
ncbi:restriction endonuclease subunit S [Bifidobacterium goeldii]|uniref:restriction endonuclease subunit S n=1 Tax=Bifidobacterium goeldii TaxID=2306975 RepID=UPI001F49D8E5|nr:restriction endonuclease subunit S [Bifidobacterium goeldii]